MTGIMAYLILGEQMTPIQLLGGGLILAGVFLLQAAPTRWERSRQLGGGRGGE